jgi:hypothetical protein
MHRPARPGAHPAPLRTPAHRAATLTTPPTGGPSTGHRLRTAVRATASVAALATVATVVVVTSRDEAAAVDPAPAAYVLTGQTVSAAHPADMLRATSVLAADHDRRLAAIAAMQAAEAAERTAQAEKKRRVEQEKKRKAEAARKAKAEAAAERRAAERRRVARSAARDPKGVARAMLASYGWSSGQFSCLDSLWTKESGWNVRADNPTSSAYGIPQALPGRKMASAGSDWRTNPATQIRWGLGYIKSTYGSPCAAWGHSQANNWY